jgi:archaemetzincin
VLALAVQCVYFSCLMQGAMSLEEAEGRLPDLCPVCLRKMLWCSGAESADAIRARYERMRSFFAANPRSFGKHLAWVESRLVSPDGSAPTCLPCADEEESQAKPSGEEEEEEDNDESVGPDADAPPTGVARMCSQDVPE